MVAPVAVPVAPKMNTQDVRQVKESTTSKAKDVSFAEQLNLPKKVVNSSNIAKTSASNKPMKNIVPVNGKLIGTDFANKKQDSEVEAFAKQMIATMMKPSFIQATKQDSGDDSYAHEVFSGMLVEELLKKISVDDIVEAVEEQIERQKVK